MKNGLLNMVEPDRSQTSYKNNLGLLSTHSQVCSQDPPEQCLVSAPSNVEQIFSIPAFLMLCPAPEKPFQVKPSIERIFSLKKKDFMKIGMGTRQEGDLQSNLMKPSLMMNIFNLEPGALLLKAHLRLEEQPALCSAHNECKRNKKTKRFNNSWIWISNKKKWKRQRKMMRHNQHISCSW